MPEELKKINLFISYAHEDAEDLQKLKEFLHGGTSPLLNIWDDGRIDAGTEWDQTIKQHLQNSQIILLLISQYFLNSSYIENTELKTAFENHAAGKCRVIPVFVKHCNLANYAQITKLQGLPRDMRFLSDMGREIDAELTKIQIEINEIASSLLTDINIAHSIDLQDEKSSNASRIEELKNKRKIFLSLPATPEAWKKRSELIIQADGERNYNDWPYEIVPGVKEAQALEKMAEAERNEALASLVQESLYSIHIVQTENDLKEGTGEAQYALAKGWHPENVKPVFRSILWLLSADLRSKLDKEFCMNTLFTGNDYGELFAKIASLDLERDKEIVELKKEFLPSKKVYMYYDFA
ncbi:MAG TPA: toll/interleukin-1 receptor domain-containing protein, partial [Flavisolibacter sp.]|nr:toll/interleukin-1 receptor domain-containing protein [Flavisolibacter sp.]